MVCMHMSLHLRGVVGNVGVGELVDEGTGRHLWGDLGALIPHF